MNIRRKSALTAGLCAFAVTLSLWQPAGARALTGTEPTEERAVTEGIVTGTAHGSAVELLEMVGINLVSGYDVTGDTAPAGIDDARKSPVLAVFGSSRNSKPDPYLWNYFYRFHAKAARLSASEPAVVTEDLEGDPVTADQTESDAYDGVSVSLSERPEILLGVSKNTKVSDLTGYDSQLKTIRLQEKDYDPAIVAYDMGTWQGAVGTVETLAETVKKKGRYGDARNIAADYESFFCGCMAGIRSFGEIRKAAVIADYDEAAGTVVLAGAKGRLSADLALTADVMTSEDGSLTLSELAGADAIVTMGSSVDGEALVKDMEAETGDAWKGVLAGEIPVTVCDPAEASGDSALVSVYAALTIYEDLCGVAPCDAAAFYYDKFYHVKSPAALADSSTLYEKEVLELIRAGARTAEETPEILAGSDLSDWQPDRKRGMLSADIKQTISGVDDAVTLKLKGKACTLKAETDGPGTITYTSSDPSVATVGKTSGKVKAVKAGTAVITVQASGSGDWQRAVKKIAVTVLKPAQKITTDFAKFTVSAEDVAMEEQVLTFSAETKEKSKITFEVSAGRQFVKVSKKGKITLKAGAPEGTYAVLVRASGTENYSEGTKTVKIVVK